MVDAGNRSPRTTPHPPNRTRPSESSGPWPQSRGGTRLGQGDLRERIIRMSRLCENPTYTQCCTTRIQRSSFGVTGSLRKHWSRCWPAKNVNQCLDTVPLHEGISTRRHLWIRKSNCYPALAPPTRHSASPQEHAKSRKL